MLTLTIRTDKPEAEIGLYEDSSKVAYEIWTAHRQLAETLHSKILDILRDHNFTLNDVSAVACFRGPGSFTGLRIGLTVANAMAYALEVPIVSESGDDWREHAIDRLAHGEADEIVLPEYGAEIHITQPKR